jgi:hypothetical protein
MNQGGPPRGGYAPQASYGQPPGAMPPQAAAAAREGRDVTLNSASFRMPSTCASCGAPQETTRTASKMNSYGNRRVTRSFQIPYCNACSARAAKFALKGVLFAFIALGIAALLALLPIAVTAIPMVVAITLALAVALAFGVVAMTALAPKPPTPPATAAGPAVRLVHFSGTQSTLHCTNPAWGEELARMNGAETVPKKRRAAFGVGALITGLIVAPLGALGAWALAHPSVYVDNASSEAIQLWIDGAPADIVAANPQGAIPPSVDVSYGPHAFGYSKTGAARPDVTVNADVTMNDAHLYNPAKTACYWLHASSYGSGTVAGISQGPQPIQEFYSFDKVDTWFGDNPQSITVQNGETGGTRVALQRAQGCMALVRASCPLAAREQFIECERAAHDDASFDACSPKALSTCGGAAVTVASTTSPTAPPHGAAPAHTAHPAPASSGHKK